MQTLVLRAIALLALFTLASAYAEVTYRPGEAPFKFETTPGALSKDAIPLLTRVEFELDPYATHFSGKVAHTIDVKRSTRSIRLNASELEITEAKLGGANVAVSIDETTQLATFTFTTEIPSGKHELSMRFKGKLGASGYGLYYAQYQVAGASKRMIATQFEAIGARRALPCFDEPAFRTVWEIAIVSDKKFTAVSNMPVKSETINGEKRRVEFQPSPSMSSYLAALAVGELERTSDTFEGIELGIYTVAGRHKNLDYAMQSTKRLLAYFKDYFGSPYQLPKLDQIAIPGKRGAMENWGLITYSEGLLSVDPKTASTESQFFSFLVIAHELAHQWFGNLVTMGWWDGLWLNESFAEWMAHKSTAALNPEWNVARRLNNARSEAMATDALAASKPIERALASDLNADEMFDSITYQKGHAVLSMIERFAGETQWRDGLRDYFVKHGYSNTTSADLWDAIGKRAGGNVQAFAASWTRQAGFPLVNVETRCVRGKQSLRLTQVRYELRADYVPAQQWNIALLVSNVSRRSKPEPVFLSSTPITIAVGRCADAVVVDAGAGGYFRVRYDAIATNALASKTSQLSKADRVRMLADAWALAEVGAQSPRVALNMIATFRASDPAELWIEAIDVYRRAEELIREGDELSALHREMRSSLAKPFTRLGWTPATAESDVEQILRSRLISALASAGDEAVQIRARQMFSVYAADETMIDGNVALGAIRAVGINATRAQINAMIGMLKSGKYPTMEFALGEAIASARDPDVARHVLGFAFDESIPRTIATRVVSRVAANGFNDRAAVDFTIQRFDELAAKSSRFAHRYIVAAPLRGSRDLMLAEKIKRLATARLEEGERLETLRAIASVERNRWAYEAIRGKIVRTGGVRQKP
jgi:aminopeptidase N